MKTRKLSSQNPKQAGLSTFAGSCPMKNKEFPDKVCPQGLLRAQWMSDNAHYLAYEERTEAPGCPWGLLTEDKHSYCFFKFIEAQDGQSASANEIAKSLCLTKYQVIKIEETAICKIKDNPLIPQLRELHRQGGLFTEDVALDLEIYFHDDFNYEKVAEDGCIEDSADLTTTVAKS